MKELAHRKDAISASAIAVACDGFDGFR